MSLQDLQKMMIHGVTSLDDVTDDTLANLGLTDEQLEAWHINIEEARDRYIEAVLSIDKILEQ